MRFGLRFVLLATVLLAVAVRMNCTEENTYVTNAPVTDQTVLSGIVYSWYCAGEWWNNPGPKEDYRFSVQTGEPAYITLVRDNGFTSWFQTDDSSNFKRYVSAGTYELIVETGFAWPPDTIYNVHLTPGDTTIELDLHYDVNDPLNIDFTFKYASVNDTAGAQAEFDALLDMNSRLRVTGHLPLLSMSGTMPPDTFRVDTYVAYDGKVYVTHRVPIRRVDYYGVRNNVIEAASVFQEALAHDTTGLYPGNLSAYPAGIYVCLSR